MIGVLPISERTAEISNGEQTIARAPAVTATFANATAESSAGALNPTWLTSDSDIEVRMVTPVMLVPGIASTAALTIAEPPDACTVKNLGARCATAFAAPLTVLGMSCSFKSRKISERIFSK